MKAWRFYAIGDMRLDEIPEPLVKPGWVVLKVRVIQPSVTEVEELHGDKPGLVRDYQEMVKEKGPLQLFGHEFSGEVVEVGEGVTNLKVGDRVFHYRAVPCHQCALCRAGYEEYCNNIIWWVGRAMPGSLAEYVALPSSILSAVPDSISDNEAAAMQPLDGAVNKVHAAKLEMGDSVVIIGEGVMGLNISQICRVCGAGKVIGIDVRDESLKLASQLGADVTINARNVDPVEAVRENTRGWGADIVFECAGGSTRQGLSGSKTLEQAINMVREGGKIVEVAHPVANATVPARTLESKNYIAARHCTPKLANYVIQLVASKRVQLTPMITHVLEGIEKVPEAFEITGNKGKYGGINPAQVVISRGK